MNAIEYLQGIREKYVGHYRAILRAKRDEGVQCTPEVWVRPNVEPDRQGPPHPLCVDIMVQEEPQPSIVLIAGEATAGSLMATMYTGEVPVKVYAAVWESLPLWVRIPDPDWSMLDSWQQKWMDVNRAPMDDEDGLGGVVHYLGRPVAEGGGYLYELDLGSAPVDALLELLDALVAMGAIEIEVGRSDGSDLPADVQAELREPELSTQQVAEIVARLIRELPEVERVERIGEDQLAVYYPGEQRERRVFVGNLHRLLHRVGPEARVLEIHRFVRGQRETITEELPDLAQLRLVIKDDRFLDNVVANAPQMKALAARKFAADLWLVCVWDAPNGMRFVTGEEPETYGLSLDQMLERAKRNYLEDRPDVELARHGPLLVARTGDCYDATLLIDDDWWTEIAGRVRGELIACVPARHLVLISGTAEPGALEEMRRAARRIEESGDHLISSTILIRKEGRWEAFNPIRTAAPRPPETPRPRRPWWRFW